MTTVIRKNTDRMNRYRQHYLCEPIYTLHGRLMAVEIVTAFTTSDEEIVSWNDVSDILTPEYKWLNFVRQLSYIRQSRDWFIDHQINVSLNLDSDTAVWLLRDRDVLFSLTALPFLRLEVHEQFENDGLLRHLHPYVALWLDDVGSGSQSNFGLMVNGYFSGAKIDKEFFWQNYAVNTVLLGKVSRDLFRYAHNVVVEGIENQGHMLSLSATPFCWLQGYLFKRTPIENIRDIPLNIGRHTTITR